jgi:hypothetical protein
MTHVFSRYYLAADLSPASMDEEIAPELVLPVEVATWGSYSVLTEGASTKVDARVGGLV